MSDYMQNYDILSTDFHDSSYDLVAEEERKKFVCKHPGCGKIFRYKSEIERHVATHSESRPFVCQYDNCFKAFKRSDALENHVRSSHTKETPFACPFPDCGMKFTTHGSFRYHVLKHNKQVPETESLIQAKAPVVHPSQPRKQVKLSSSQEQPVMFNQGPKKADPALEKLGQESLGDDFFAPAPPRYASKIQWQVVGEESEAPTEDSEKLNQVTEENKVLKQKLATSEKIIKSMQKQINDLLGSLFAYQSQAGSRPENSTYQDFSIPRDSFLQGDFLASEPKSEEVPLFDMSNYGEEMNFFSAAEPKTEMESNIDGFLSFGNTFEF
jgi:hypothetical protein